jgi:hypothetical protein
MRPKLTVRSEIGPYRHPQSQSYFSMNILAQSYRTVVICEGQLAFGLFAKLTSERNQLGRVFQAIEKTSRNTRQSNLRADKCSS